MEDEEDAHAGVGRSRAALLDRFGDRHRVEEVDPVLHRTHFTEPGLAEEPLEARRAEAVLVEGVRILLAAVDEPVVPVLGRLVRLREELARGLSRSRARPRESIPPGFKTSYQCRSTRGASRMSRCSSTCTVRISSAVPGSYGKERMSE
jgi:hypothetical protein